MATGSKKSKKVANEANEKQAQDKERNPKDVSPRAEPTKCHSATGHTPEAETDHRSFEFVLTESATPLRWQQGGREGP
jgi:hypothetical protein